MPGHRIELGVQLADNDRALRDEAKYLTMLALQSNMERIRFPTSITNATYILPCA